MNGYEYVYGSTAKKRIQEDPYVVKRIQKKTVRVKKCRKDKRKVLFCTILCFAVIMFVMVRYAAILRLNYRIAEMNHRYDRIVAENSVLNAKLKEITSLSAIYDRAVHDLGMIEAGSDHVAYFSVAREDKKVIDRHYIEEKKAGMRDPVTLAIERIRLFLNLK